jgi:hypothetical protein
MSNIEQGLPAFGGARGDQGISNDEVKSLLFLPSAFVIRPARYARKQILYGSSLTSTVTAPSSQRIFP